MRIILIIPPSYVNKHSTQGLLPCLGITYIAAVLEKAGHTVKLIDSQINNYTFTDILRITKEFDPQV